MITGNSFSFGIEHEPKGCSLMLNNGLVGDGVSCGGLVQLGCKAQNQDTAWISGHLVEGPLTSMNAIPLRFISCVSTVSAPHLSNGLEAHWIFSKNLTLFFHGTIAK